MPSDPSAARVLDQQKSIRCVGPTHARSRHLTSRAQEEPKCEWDDGATEKRSSKRPRPNAEENEALATPPSISQPDLSVDFAYLSLLPDVNTITQLAEAFFARHHVAADMVDRQRFLGRLASATPPHAALLHVICAIGSRHIAQESTWSPEAGAYLHHLELARSLAQTACFTVSIGTDLFDVMQAIVLLCFDEVGAFLLL